MPTESELRQWLHDQGATLPAHRELDAGRIIRRSKRRRLPRQIGVGGATTLAVAGIAVGGFTGLKPVLQGTATTSGASQSLDRGGSELAPARDLGTGTPAQAPMPAQGLNLCGSPVASVPPDRSGLVLTPHFPSSVPANGEPVDGTVTLTNTGTTTVTGSTAASAVITVSDGGIVLWHSNGPTIMLARLIDLAPGQSMDLPAFFSPLRCEAGDDKPEGFPDNLPPLAAGRYQVGALLGVSRGGAAGLVGGPSVPIDLR
ncbi:hypothetical protein GCM10027052_07220 [Parafrigoribacterium mesophilum]|uniref:hypothetical protein n=1 Tax=Parafrigoribacterium mesophilum TaxID=433646 RepID=UPI0031FD7474